MRTTGLRRLFSKEEGLKAFIEAHVSGSWDADFDTIMSVYQEKQEEIDNDFLQAIREVCRQVQEKQETGRKGKIKYLYISYMRTGVMENGAPYRVEAFDERWYLDMETCRASWGADFLFAPLYARVSEWEEKKSAYIGTVTSMDIEEIKQMEGLRYHNYALELMRSLVPKVMELEEYKQMKKDERIQLLAGEYRDESELLAGEWKQEKEEG